MCSTTDKKPEQIPTEGPDGVARPGYRDLPVVAIVGRPNVGKSTLFNRIVRGRIAIVDDQPGVTRDRNYRETYWAGKRFFVVDTGGLVPSSEDTIETLVRKQVETAIEEAVLVVFVVDAASGLTPLDKEIAQTIRKTRKKYLVVANKVDTGKGRAQTPEFYELGLGDFIEISAEQGYNLGDLLDAVTERLPAIGGDAEDLAAITVVGKPNVGKSSLVNRLAGSETVIVDDQPGTTRDSIDTLIDTAYGPVKLVDTAGLRRKSRTNSDLEKYANIRSMGAIDRSDVVVLMLDSDSGLAKQDLTIAAYVEKSGKGMVIAWNKWDLKGAEDETAYIEMVKNRLRHLPHIPVVFTSCLTGRGIDSLVETCFRVRGNRDTRIPTGVLNRALLPAVERKPPGSRGKRFGRVYYVAQTGSKPPAFTMFVNDTSFFTDNYRRYIEKQVRRLFSFEGCPVRIRIRKSK
ncbi:MAG: ribosome biogenesis GTPase Der [Candidatus Eisenbacteria bacterium]